MELEIFWTNFAKTELNNIFNYFKNKVSLKVARKIVKDIILSIQHLKNQPEAGSIEELLKVRTQKFRYIISTNYKIIYCINFNKERVEIIDVFDTKQNPIKIIKRN